MFDLEEQRKFITDVYNKEPEATELMVELLYNTIRNYFFKHQRIKKDTCNELVAEALTALWNKKEPPKISGEAHIYLLGIAIKIHLYKKTRNKEDPVQDTMLDEYPSADNIIAQMEVSESVKLVNNLLARLSRRCKELLEKTILEDKPKDICRDMDYSSMNTYYKMKSTCMEQLKSIAKNDPECCCFFNLD